MSYDRYKNSILTFALTVMLIGCASAPPPRPSMQSPAHGLMGELVGSHTYYPDLLLLARKPGRALVAYSVGPGGAAERVEVVQADDPAFGSSAMQFVRDWHFDVPGEWSRDGGPAQRFRLQLVFVIDGKPIPKPWYPDVVTIPINGHVH